MHQGLNPSLGYLQADSIPSKMQASPAQKSYLMLDTTEGMGTSSEEHSTVGSQHRVHMASLTGPGFSRIPPWSRAQKLPDESAGCIRIDVIHLLQPPSPFIYPFNSLSTQIHPSIHLPIHLPIYPLTLPHTHASTPPIYLLTHPPTHLSICLSIHVLTYPPI